MQESTHYTIHVRFLIPYDGLYTCKSGSLRELSYSNQGIYVDIKKITTTEEWDRMKELASALSQSLFTFLLLPPSLLLLLECLAISRIPMAVHFLISGLGFSLGVGHNSNVLQCLTVKMSFHYTLYLEQVQSLTPSSCLFPVPSVHLPFPLLCCSHSTQQEDFHTSSNAASAFFFGVLFLTHERGPFINQTNISF